MVFRKILVYLGLITLPHLSWANDVHEYHLKNGLSFKVSQGNVLQLCPPLIITREQITDAILIIRGALQSVQS